MTCIIVTQTKSRLTMRVVKCLLTSAFLVLVLGMPIAPSNAEEHGGHHAEEHQANRGHDERDKHHFHTPPVVYGSRQCKAPPLVYGNDLLCPY